MHDVDASLVDEPLGELPLLERHLIAPVAAPVDRCDDHIAFGLHAVDPLGHAPDGSMREIGQEVHSAPALRCAL